MKSPDLVQTIINNRLATLFLCFMLAYLIFPLNILCAAEPLGWQDLGLYGGQVNDIAIDPADPNIRNGR